MNIEKFVPAVPRPPFSLVTGVIGSQTSHAEVTPGTRILLINLYFGVGPAPTGGLAESAARGLLRNGYQVDVLAGRVGYNARNQETSRSAHPNVCWQYLFFRDTEGVLGRLTCWLNFYVAVTWWVFTHPMPSRVILMSTPPFMHVILVVRRWFSATPVHLVLWNQDTYPEILVAVGLLRPTSLVYRFLLWIECWTARRLDRVLVLDAGMKQRLLAHGVRSIEIVPNWELERDHDSERMSHTVIDRIREAGRSFRYIVLYSGNYGFGHDLTLIDRFVRRDPRQRLFFFVFIGGGEKWPLLHRLRDEVGAECMVIASYVPRSAYHAIVREAHFGLVTLDSACVGLMSPSKIHSYLALGRPLIYLGSAGSNVSEAIEDFDCGFAIAETDDGQWERFLQDIQSAEFSYEGYAANAERAFQSCYQESVGVQRFCTCVG